MPAYEEDLAYRVEFFGDEIERISEIDPLTGKVRQRIEKITIYPGSHHVTPEECPLTCNRDNPRGAERKDRFF